MKCPECVKLGVASRVYPIGEYSTLMYCPTYYDEEGRLHDHDTNVTTRRYRCSNVHFWSEEVTKPCPACGENWR